MARSAPGLSTLHEATRGNPSSSPRWQANMRLGGDQEMIAALRTRAGDVWGAVGLYREPGQPIFDASDKAFLHAVTPTSRRERGARCSWAKPSTLTSHTPEA